MAQAIEDNRRFDPPGAAGHARSFGQMQAANKIIPHNDSGGLRQRLCISFTCRQISHLPMLAVGINGVRPRECSDTPDQMERGLFRLRIGNAQHQVIFEAIERGDAVRAEGMMREHSHTMIEYIETFEKRDKSLTASNLVAYSAAEPDAPQV